MKTIELVEPYLNSLGLRFVDGESESYAPVMIFCIHDLIYQIVTRKLTKIEYKGKPKKLRNDWVRLCHLHFRNFFSQLDKEREAMVVDLMDDFTEFIGNEMMIVKCKVMDTVAWMGFEDQKELAELQLVNIISQLGTLHWQSLIRERDQSRSKLRFNQAARYYSCSISEYYADKYGRKEVDEPLVKNLMKAVESLDARMVKWVDDRTTEKIGNDGNGRNYTEEN